MQESDDYCEKLIADNSKLEKQVKEIQSSNGVVSVAASVNGDDSGDAKVILALLSLWLFVLYPSFLNATVSL